MNMRSLALALMLAVTASSGFAQSQKLTHPKTPKAAKFKASKVNTKNQAKFQKSHDMVKHATPKAPAKHTATKGQVHKFVKPKN
jgi:hypothetical protein